MNDYLDVMIEMRRLDRLYEIIDELQEINSILDEESEDTDDENQSQELPENGFTYPAKSKRNDPYSV